MTIITFFENDELMNELSKYCKRNNIEILKGELNSSDVVAYNYDISIIDRNFIDSKQYESYIEFIKEVNTPIEFSKTEQQEELVQEISVIKDEHFCILIDELDEMKKPLLDVVIQINPSNKNFVEAVLCEIDNILKRT